MERAWICINEMRKLEHVTDGDRLVELLAVHAVEEVEILPACGRPATSSRWQLFARSVEYRRGEGNAFAEARTRATLRRWLSVFQIVVSVKNSRPTYSFGADFLA